MSQQDFVSEENKVVRIAAVPDDGTRLLTLTDDDGTIPTRENSSQASPQSPGSSCSSRWSEMILTIHRPTMAMLKAISGVSARNPKLTIAIMTVISLGLISVGFLTNFYFNGDTETLWTPSSSIAMQHYEWIQNDSGFAPPSRYFALMFHQSGDNVLNRNAAQHAFEALDVMRNHKEFDAACAYGDFVVDGTPECLVLGLTRMWSNSATEFARTVDDDDDVRRAAAKIYFPDGLDVPHERLYGSLERNQTYASFAKAFLVIVALPDQYEGIKKVELEMVDDLLELQKSWVDQGDSVVMEVVAHGSIPAELIRAVNEDLPLIPLVFVMMATFTSAVFAKRNPVYSRSGLGASAVVAVFLSIVAGFGLMFIIGVPFTSITQLIPFLVFGIGLDDAFIVVGSYIRTDPMKDPVKRIEETIEDIGLSITLTTLTTATAFGLGCSSSVPAVYWLCQYCFPTIFFVLLYQLTFFVACIVLDERRIQARRRDILICCEAPATIFEAPQMRGHFTDRFMEAYAKILLHPVMRVLVFIGFACLLVASTFSFLQLEQKFEIQDVIPRVSYTRDFLDADKVYFDNTGSFSAEIYFRDVDHSNATVRQQMKDYMNAVSELDFVDEILPTSIWLSSFDLNIALLNPRLLGVPFNEQVEAFLGNEIFRNGFAQHLVLDDEGNIIASKIPIRMRADLSNVHDQIDVLNRERELTFSVDVNQGRDGGDFAFFTFADIYTVFEFYLVCLKELIWTTIYGVAAVSAVAMLFIPHISAVFIVFPMICVLYVDLLGVIQWSGLYINAMTYLGLTMSIGLLVDFIMHVLFRYYEVPGNRVQKTTEMLKTMGASILLGGMTTFLGTIPLYFTSSNAFRVIFTVFVGIVSLGVGHGLILMPVILATIGPETQISMSYRKKENSTSGGDYQTADAVRSATGFGELEDNIVSFQNLVASANIDKEKRFEEILSFVVNYAQSVGVDPEVVLQQHSAWGSAEGEASTDEGSVTSGKKEAFSEALMELFQFAKTNGLDPEAALKKRKAAAQFTLKNTAIRGQTAMTYPDFDNASQSEDEC